MPKVEVERRGAVAVVTLNRPEVHNCIDGETAGLLSEAIRSLSDDPEAMVMVVTGAGGRAFSSGADLRAMDDLFARPDVGETGPLGFAHLETGKPSIAAIEGHCYAGGLELACWCDVRVAGKSSTFGVLNRRWGVPLVDGGTQRLPRIVGSGNALYLIETGVRIDAARALAMGLVQEVVPDGAALERALELAGRIAEYPQAALRADRENALATFGSLGEGLRLEGERGLASAEDPAMAEGLRRFAERDRPDPPTPP